MLIVALSFTLFATRCDIGSHSLEPTYYVHSGYIYHTRTTHVLMRR